MLRQLSEELKRGEGSGGGHSVLKGEVLNGGISVLLDNPEPLVRERAFFEVTGGKEQAFGVGWQDRFADKDVKSRVGPTQNVVNVYERGASRAGKDRNLERRKLP